MPKNIIVVGYPKSGNTWITRLVAELVDCPVTGFWKSKHPEIAIEGENRISEYKCYKSHHSYAELEDVIFDSQSKIIYLVRDPRDIILSGANFFKFYRYPKLVDLLKHIPKGEGLHYHTLYRVFHSRAYRIEKMIETVLYGRKETHKWCQLSWETHVQPFLSNKIFYLLYENMLTQPEYEAKRILSFLELECSHTQIEIAIMNQSFNKRKAEFSQTKSRRKVKYLRKGRSGEWKNELSNQQKALIWAHLGKVLASLGYPET